MAAYQVREFQIVGGSAWIDSGQFDVEAERHGTPAGQGEWFDAMSAMLQPLLQEKLHLRFHRETRRLPVYTLSAAKDRVKFHRSRQQDCKPFIWNRNPIPPDARWAPDYCGAVETGPNARLNHTLDAVGMKISEGRDGLAATLAGELDRLVIDKTGLSGSFDIRLEWNRDATSRSVKSGIYDAPPIDADSPSIFTAVEEQLGLKLAPHKGAVEVLVIDHAEMPAVSAR